MQIIIDTNTDGAAEMRAAIVLLTTLAAAMPPPADMPFPFAPVPPIEREPAPIMMTAEAIEREALKVRHLQMELGNALAVDRAPQWSAEKIEAMRANPQPPMVLPTIPAPPAFIPPPPPVSGVTGPAPSTATPAPAPTAAATSSASAAPPGMDSAGLPWDARIHSDTHKTNVDGTWRFRRNVDDAVKSAVVAELRAQHPQAAPALPIPPPPPMVALPPVSVPAIPAPPAAAAPYPTVAAPSVIPPPPPAAVAAAPTFQPATIPAGPVTDFKQMMAKCGAMMQAGRLNHPQLAAGCLAVGVASLPGLMAEPDKIPLLDAWLNANVLA